MILKDLKAGPRFHFSTYEVAHYNPEFIVLQHFENSTQITQCLSDGQVRYTVGSNRKVRAKKWFL